MSNRIVFFNRNPHFIPKKVVVKTDNKFSRGNLDKHLTSDYFTSIRMKYLFINSNIHQGGSL